MPMSVTDALARVSLAQNQLAKEVEQEYPIGSRVRVSWMHESNPLVEIIMLYGKSGGFKAKFLEDVPHRIKGKPPLRVAGQHETMSVEWVTEKCL